MRPVSAAYPRASLIAPSGPCSSSSRHRCQPSTAGASISMICRTTGSPASRIQARAPARSVATGSGASRAMASPCWAMRAPTSSRTAQNNASFPGKWW